MTALGAVVATDAGGSRELAWAGTGCAAVLVAIGLAAGSYAPVHSAVAVLALMLLLRHDIRLLLAPLYGGGLLVMAELGTRSIELRAVTRVGQGAISARVAAVLAVASAGAAAAAVAALAVTRAPGRSVPLTAAGALAVVIACGAIALYARRG